MSYQNYQINQFNRDINNDVSVVEVLTRLSYSPYKGQIIQQVASGNYDEAVKTCVGNIDFILQNAQHFSGMNWTQVAGIIQGNDVRGVNIGFVNQYNSYLNY